MLEAFFTLFLSLLSFPAAPAVDPGVAVPVVEEPATTTLVESEEDARGVFDPDGLSLQNPRDANLAPKG